MCISLLIAAAVVTVAAAGVGTYASIQSANANAKAAKYEAQLQTKQLYRQREGQRISALQQENGRTEQYNQARSSAMAAIGASGLGEHISFFQSIDPNARKAFLRDAATIRLNLATSEASIADQVQLTEVRKNIAVFNSQMSKVGAIADFIQTAMSAASSYASYSTPTPATAGGK